MFMLILAGFGLAVLGAACSLPRAREGIQRLFDNQNETAEKRAETKLEVLRWMDNVKFVLVVGGVALGGLAYHYRSEEKAEVRAQLVAEGEARKALARQMGDRILDDKQTAALAEIGKRFAGRTLRLGAVNDPEAIRYAVRIETVLRVAGVKIAPVGLGALIPAKHGLHCGPDELSTAIAEVLPGCGPMDNAKVATDSDLAVLLKPPPPLIP